MLRRALRCAWVSLCLFACATAMSGPVYIPGDLEPWKAWVLQDEAFRLCPFLSSATRPDPDAFRCAWPERLTLALDSRGGTFTQRWQLSGESWIKLPGDLEHWPTDVLVDGRNADLVAREGVPQLYLPAGEHRISGAFRFVTRPAQIAIDPRTALVQLTLDGRAVAQPERPNGALWLGNRRTSDEPQRTLVQVYRLVKDEVPVNLTTLIRLRISGTGREESLGPVLPDGFTPMSLESQLPARLEPDGRLRVQVRAGQWDIRLLSRGTSVASELRRPPKQGEWAEEEIWSFAGDERLRVAAAEGPPGVDPDQANVPQDWREYPAFRMTSDSVLKVSERTRGLQNADDTNLRLTRRIWLDFDDRGWTAVDRISGTLLRQWRLEMASPFRLESAAADEHPLLVSQNPGRTGTGVEVRSPGLDLSATARLQGGSGSMPATGWDTRFVQASGELNLPPGHRLVAVVGADHAPGAWLEQWGLWAAFGVLVVAAAARWLRGWRIGLVALVGLTLMYPEAPGYLWLWANVLIAAALTATVPEGHLRRSLRAYRAVSFVVLGVALLPFLFEQVRLALYPQLETEGPGFAYLPGLLAATPVRTFAVDRLTAKPEAAGARTDSPPPRPLGAIAGQLAEVVVTGQKRTDEITPVQVPYASDTVLQAGPAIPGWRYRSYEYSWSGPLEPGAHLRFVFVGPLALGLWRIAGAVLLAALFLALLEPGRLRELRSWLTRARDRGGDGASGDGGSGGGGVSGGDGSSGGDSSGGNRSSGGGHATALLFLGLLACAAAGSVCAASVPDAAILDQLKARLTRAPQCLPTCSDITSATLTVHDNQLVVSLVASALAPLALPVPTADRWQLTGVSLDGRAALAVGRESDATTWVPVTPGIHTIVLTGTLAPAQAIQLTFPVVPHRVSVSSKGWDITGLNDEQHLVSGSLELVDRRVSNRGGPGLGPARDFPVFARVTRQVSFGLTWNVLTTVERLAPLQGALSLEVPLLEGESVLGTLPTRKSADGRTVAVVGLEPGAASTAWMSTLAEGRRLRLAQPAADSRIEVWRLVATPQWHLAFNGIPGVLPEGAGRSWVYEFYPRPGEQLEVSLSRPQAAAGSSLAIDSVEQVSRPGKRATETTLRLAYRSTQGGRHTIQLPPHARVTAVELDEQSVALRPEHDELSVSLLPGEHSVEVRWSEPTPVGVRTRVSPVDLHSPAGNVRTVIELGPDRWPLFALGGGVGPAILYWSELAVFLLSAVLVGRWPSSPLRTYEWILLGLGLSTLSWAVLLLVAVWQFSLQWRGRWDGSASAWRFNLTQVALALLTACAVGALLLAGVRQSLLSSPDMAIAGDGSGSGVLSWFADRSTGALPRPVVISAPLWLYRLLMLAWAFWIVTALLRWIRSAWAAWQSNGSWRREVTLATAAAPSAGRVSAE